MRILLMAAVGALFLASCGGGGEKDQLVTIKTNRGDMTVLLYEETPLHKENFLKLATSGAYDSTTFHRIIEDFMVQGGDIYRGRPEQESEEDRIPAEIVEGFYHTKGALAAARQGDQFNPEKKSSSCQFYIVDGQQWTTLTLDLNTLHQKVGELLQDSLNNPELFAEFDVFRQNRDRQGYNKWVITKKDFIEEKFDVQLEKPAETQNDEAYEDAGAGAPFLDGEYTVFGRVVEGLDVIDKLAAVETVSRSPVEKDVPVDPIYMSMEVIEMSKAEITEKYGYDYPKE